MTDEVNSDPPTSKQVWRRVRRTCYVLVAIGVLGPLLAFGVLYCTVSPPIPSAMLKAQGSSRPLIGIDQVPQSVQHAVEAAEDPTFETSSGFGGSGIAQQYVRMATGAEGSGLGTKAATMVRSVKLNQEASKAQIMEGYLNTVYFGRGAHGIQDASKKFFGKDVQDLNLAEAAFLAGCISNPTHSDDTGWTTDRWHWTMDRMSANGWITPADKAKFTVPPTPIP